GLPRTDGLFLTFVLGSDKISDRGIARAAHDDPRLNDLRILSDARNQILAGLNDLPKTAANRATVTTVSAGLHNQISVPDLPRTRELAHNLAFALANDRYPNDSKKAIQETQRLEALLTRSPAGATLLLYGPPEKRAAALEGF